MSALLEQIIHLYPLLAKQLLSVPADESSVRRFLQELGTHVVDLYGAGRPEDMRPAFSLAERLISGGPEEERQAAVGFLEAVQNVASHRHCGPTAFVPYLGPLSETVWAELNHVWQGKTTLAEVVASETGARLEAPWWQFWRRNKKRSVRRMLEEVEDPELRKIIEQITRE